MTALLLSLALFGAPDAGSCEQMVQERGDVGMGFSHAKTAHHFSLTQNGGTIFAEANDSSDTVSRDSMRRHMQHVAGAFTAGDFAMPMFIHGREPPGVPTMKRLKDRITYVAQDTEKGARVAIQTSDPEALKAVHAFLRFQIKDHHTADSVGPPH